MTHPNFKDLTGQKFGKLTVIKRVENNMYGAAKWLCKCDCGRERAILGSYLFRGLKTHCGCENKYVKSSNFKDMTGQKIGKLTVIERAQNYYGRAQWLCKCECGNEIIVRSDYLRSNIVICCNTCRKESEQE